MNTGTPPRAADGARLGTALTRRAAINAATQAYLRGEAVDMSALAAQLGIGRSTLYRLVGNRDDLLEVVLAEGLHFSGRDRGKTRRERDARAERSARAWRTVARTA